MIKKKYKIIQISEDKEEKKIKFQEVLFVELIIVINHMGNIKSTDNSLN